MGIELTRENLQVLDQVSSEIIRKLRLAATVDTNEDLEIICEEVFSDVTGLVEEKAQAALGLDTPCFFFQLLAAYYFKVSDAAEALLYVCRKVWHQPYIAPVFALLLHRWLLLRAEAGGAEQRQISVNVLLQGARDVFFGDLLSAAHRFSSVFECLAYEVVTCSDHAAFYRLPAQARCTLMEVVAAFLPYYATPQEFHDMLGVFPSSIKPPPPGAAPVERDGADYVLWEVSHQLRRVTSEGSMLKYLQALRAVAGSEHFHTLRARTLLHLQYELFTLSKPGGPRYAPKDVNKAASDTMDMLFSSSRLPRRIVHLVFSLWIVPIQCWTWLYARVVAYILVIVWGLLASLRKTRQGPKNKKDS